MDLPDFSSASPHRSGIVLGGPYSVRYIQFMPIYTVDGQAERKATNAKSRSIVSGVLSERFGLDNLAC